MTCSACEATNPAGALECHACAAELTPTGSSADEPAVDPAAVDTAADLAPLDAPAGDDGSFGADDDAVPERTLVAPSRRLVLRPAFVGRVGLLEELVERSTRHLAERRLGAVLVTGEAGSGKSRLLEELGRRLGEHTPEVRVLGASA